MQLKVPGTFWDCFSHSRVAEGWATNTMVGLHYVEGWPKAGWATMDGLYYVGGSFLPTSAGVELFYI